MNGLIWPQNGLIFMILMNDFKAEPQELRQAMLTAVGRVIDSGWYILGQEVKNFEQQWAKVCDLQFGVGVGNGLQAIEIALRALNIGPGDEVITTPMTAFATVLAILRAGAIPVLADIEPDTALLSLESAQRSLSIRTKAVLIVHLYGQVANMQAWVDWCAACNIALVEDCAQAHGAYWGGRSAGSFGQIGAFSFYPTKNLGALGDAGLIVTNDPSFASKAARLRNYGESIRGHHSELGMNSRMDEIQAAILLERLPWLIPFTRSRRKIANAYRNGICNPKVKLLRAPDDSASHVYHLFVINCEARDALIAHLRQCGIDSLIHYPLPIHLQKPCEDLARDPNGLTNSLHHANTCISIPCHPHMSDADVIAVIAGINSFTD